MDQYWLAFTQVNGLGPVRLRQLRAQFENIQAAWLASGEDLRACGMPTASLEHQQQLRKTLQPEKLLEAVERIGAWVLTLDHPDYPSLLREISDAPAVLYVKGTITAQDERALAIVGTRKASRYGKEMTQRLAMALSAARVTIVSGLAYGIDIMAHEATLSAGGRTIAVLASGLDVIYPSEHRHIAQNIIEQGALISEYAPGIKPDKGNFLVRNRIISGLSLGTLVIEAPERSGSLSTANRAGEQGREVFAVPGNADAINSRGANLLIQDGAKLVMSAEDILNELDLHQVAAQTRHEVKEIAPTNERESLLLNALKTEALHVDELCRVCNLSISEINVALTLMELKGMVYQVAPMTYQIA